MPGTEQEQIEWLYERWQVLDDWVGEQRGVRVEAMGLVRRIAILVIATIVLALPAGASAWQASFSKFFSLSGVNGQAHKLVMQKCHGIKFGDWTLTAKHYVLIQNNSSDLFVQLICGSTSRSPPSTRSSR